MARYIDADKAKHEFNIGFGGVSHAVIANQIIDRIPTSDVVEVVRCKDCKYCYPIGENACFCRNVNSPWYNDEFEVYTDIDSFCSYGERKKEE